MARRNWWIVLLAVCTGLGTWGCFRYPPGPPVGSLPPLVTRRPTVTAPPTRSKPALTPPPAVSDELQRLLAVEAAERPWRYIVLHHTGTDAGSVESIHRAHLRRKDKYGRHWLGIGYHFVVGNGNGMGDGEVEPTFRWKQQIQGAHAGVSEYNEYGIGIALVGNFEKHRPTSRQLASVEQLVSALCRRYGIPPERVLGHRDIKATACPGRLFPLEEIRQQILFSGRGGRSSTTVVVQRAGLVRTY